MQLISKDEIVSVVNKLNALQGKSKVEAEGENLFEKDIRYHAVLTLANSTTSNDRKYMKMTLPHPVRSADTTICVICTDEMKKPLKELLSAHPELNVVKIMKLGKIKSVYRTFDSRRKLAGMYDIFIADSAAYLSLFRALGKPFFNHKFPFVLPIKNSKGKLRKEALPAAIAEIRSSANIRVANFSTCVDVNVATEINTSEQVADNLIHLVENIKGLLPKNANVISSVYIKTDTSPAVPVSINKGQEQN